MTLTFQGIRGWQPSLHSAAIFARGCPSDALKDVVFERERQKSVEGWTEWHDDGYVDCELSQAAACYASEHPDEKSWPSQWNLQWFKPKGRRRNLVRAGALILAEIERLDRAAPEAPESRSGTLTNDGTEEKQ